MRQMFNHTACTFFFPPECPGHSSDDEPLSKLTESKGAKRSSKQKETGEHQISSFTFLYCSF